MSPVVSVFSAMLHKDLRRELRSREIFISSFLFSIILLTVIYFASTSSGVKYELMGAGALWLCITFSGTIGLNRTHQSEMVNNCYRGLILSPADGGWLYLAKVCSNWLLLSAMEVLLLPLIALFFHVDLLQSPGWLALSLLLGTGGFVAVGTLVVVITANTRMKDVLFPVVQLPLVVPALIAGVNSTEVALRGQSPWNWIQFLLALNVVFLSVGFLLYEFLLEE
ncbi:Heme exporter protein B [Sulfidibacter corallicola]|uniref:Heme exporter protein B n=1 Tax=Sulfidibacter corallicola TaxID=2818388 RepID=A0A8A4TT54_SULCO|nr:heme exporter protein CcmB [Sulfidibacter corallicola]QTD52232.1 heme exporter protein CcmB [Sulfidibacter corallicola]